MPKKSWELKLNAVICKQTVFTDNIFMKCCQAYVVMSLYTFQ